MKQMTKTSVERCVIVALQVLYALLSELLKTPSELHCELLEHPPYSHELAPSDYHLFIQRCFNIRDHKYALDQELKDLVHKQLANVVKNICLGAHRRFLTTGLLISRGTMYKMMLLHISYCYCINFK